MGGDAPESDSTQWEAVENAKLDAYEKGFQAGYDQAVLDQARAFTNQSKFRPGIGVREGMKTRFILNDIDQQLEIIPGYPHERKRVVIPYHKVGRERVAEIMRRNASAKECEELMAGAGLTSTFIQKAVSREGGKEP